MSSISYLIALKGKTDPRQGKWSTPSDFFALIQEEFDLQIDVCATKENTKLPRYFDRETNGLRQPWAPHRCWMNPPYGKRIVTWLIKARAEAIKGALVVCLLPVRTDTDWWHRHVLHAHEIRFLKGRIKFSEMPGTATFGSCIVVFGPGRSMEGPVIRWG